MTDKQIKEDICPYQGECSINGCKRNDDGCFIKQLFEERYRAEKQIVKLNKTIKTKEQENEELRQYHNKCCEENAKKMEEWLEKYKQVSRDFHNGKYCNTEHCSLLNAKEQECNKLYIQLKADEEYHKEEENTLRKIIKNKEERNIELYKENNQLKVNNEKMSKGYAELTEIVSPYIDDFTGYNEELGGFDIVLCVKELLQQLNQLKTENDRLMILKDKTYFKLKEEYLRHLDQLKTERDKIKAIGDNYFDEYEMCCLDLPDAINSLLKRYDNAFAKFKKERKELKENCEELKSLLKVRIEDLCDSCGASSMMPMPCKVYEKTLIEIKEIIKQGVKIHDDIIVSKQILQKISECEVENA